MKKQRLRITFGITEALRYVSHLDKMGIWERTARRAGIPMAYSAGYNPRPQMQIAAALPVGFAARGELADLWLSEPVDPEAAYEALEGKTPPGLSVVRVAEIDLDEPAMQTRVCAADYTAEIEIDEPLKATRRRVDTLLAADSLPRVRRRPYDLRALVQHLRAAHRAAGFTTLKMTLTVRPGATGRPEEVIDQLGLGDAFFRITRDRLMLEDLP